MLEFITSLDAAMAGLLPPLARIAVWAVISGVFSMFLYKYISPQKKLAVIKAEHKQVRSALIKYDGEFDGMQKLILKDLGLALKQMGIIFGPFLVSVVPVVALMFCLFVLYGFAFPAPGQAVTVTISPSAQVQWLPPQSAHQTAENTWEVTWPAAGSTTRLRDSSGQELLVLPLAAPIPEVTKENWLTALFPNPAGSIKDDATVDAVHVDIPGRVYTTFGPQWMQGFEFWYILILLAVSLFIKFRFKII